MGATAIALGLSAPSGQATTDCAADAMLVFDGSASMGEISFETGTITRIVEARAALRDAMPDIEPFRRVGLMIYGPGPLGSCENVDLRFRPREDAAAPVIAAAEALRPDGLTPLTRAVEKAAEALDYQNEPGVVVLVTDGNETCGGRPCDLAQSLVATSRNLTVHVIGFRAVVDFFSWNNPEQDPTGSTTVARCLADETGGVFVTTETVDELVAALQQTLGCPVIGRTRGVKIMAEQDRTQMVAANPMAAWFLVGAIGAFAAMCFLAALDRMAYRLGEAFAMGAIGAALCWAAWRFWRYFFKPQLEVTPDVLISRRLWLGDHTLLFGNVTGWALTEQLITHNYRGRRLPVPLDVMYLSATLRDGGEDKIILPRYGHNNEAFLKELVKLSGKPLDKSALPQHSTSKV